MKHFLLVDSDNEYGFTDDPLRAARGIALAVVISLVAVVVAAAVIWRFL